MRSVRYGCKAHPLGSAALSVPGLSQIAFGDAEATEVVHQPGPADLLRSRGVEAELAGRGAGEVGHAARVAERVRRLQVGEVGDRLQRVVETSRRRARSRHGAARRRSPPPSSSAASRSSNSVAASARDQLDQGRVELRARSRSARPRPRRRSPSLRWKTSTTSARFTSRARQRISSPFVPLGHALAVPALERLVQAVADRRGRARADPPARRPRTSGSRASPSVAPATRRRTSAPIGPAPTARSPDRSRPQLSTDALRSWPGRRGGRRP